MLLQSIWFVYKWIDYLPLLVGHGAYHGLVSMFLCYIVYCFGWLIIGVFVHQEAVQQQATEGPRQYSEYVGFAEGLRAKTCFGKNEKSVHTWIGGNLHAYSSSQATCINGERKNHLIKLRHKYPTM